MYTLGKVLPENVEIRFKAMGNAAHSAENDYFWLKMSQIETTFGEQISK